MENKDFEALKERIKLGNQKLWEAWCQIKELAEDKERWSAEMDRLHRAFLKLDALCDELKIRYNYYDCLYLDENGTKTRGCLHNPNGFFCRVCPCSSDRKYWEEELMSLPSPSSKP